MKMMPLALALAILFSFSGCGQEAESTAQEPISSTVTSVPAGSTLPAVSYKDLTEDQLALFEETGKVGVEDVKSYAITMDFMEMNQNDLIKGYVEMNKLPSNGVALFQEWKAKTDYYSRFSKGILADNLRNENGTSILDEQKPDVQTPSENDNNQNPSENNQKPSENNNQKPVTPSVTPDPEEPTPPVTPNKPIKTPEQVEQQRPSTNDDSGVPLTPDEMKDFCDGSTDGSNGGGGYDMDTHGYDVEGW